MKQKNLKQPNFSLEWINLTQMIIIPTSVAKNPSEEME